MIIDYSLLKSITLPSSKNGNDNVDDDKDKYGDDVDELIHKISDTNELKLSYLKITQIANLEPFTKIQKLCLDNNHLKDCQGLESLVHLKWLDLSFNQIISKGIRALKYCKNLEDLSLFHNQINNISSCGCLDSLHGLECLSIGHNRLGIVEEEKEESLDTLGEYLQRFPKLRMLTILGNPFCDSGENDTNTNNNKEKRKNDHDLVAINSNSSLSTVNKNHHNSFHTNQHQINNNYSNSRRNECNAPVWYESIVTLYLPRLQYLDYGLVSKSSYIQNENDSSQDSRHNNQRAGEKSENENNINNNNVTFVDRMKVLLKEKIHFVLHSYCKDSWGMIINTTTSNNNDNSDDKQQTLENSVSKMLLNLNAKTDEHCMELLNHINSNSKEQEEDYPTMPTPVAITVEQYCQKKEDDFIQTCHNILHKNRQEAIENSVSMIDRFRNEEIEELAESEDGDKDHNYSEHNCVVDDILMSNDMTSTINQIFEGKINFMNENKNDVTLYESLMEMEMTLVDRNDSIITKLQSDLDALLKQKEKLYSTLIKELAELSKDFFKSLSILIYDALFPSNHNNHINDGTDQDQNQDNDTQHLTIDSLILPQEINDLYHELEQMMIHLCNTEIDYDRKNKQNRLNQIRSFAHDSHRRQIEDISNTSSLKLL